MWMQARGHRVMTVSPRYDQYKDAWDTNTPIEVCAVSANERLSSMTLLHSEYCASCRSQSVTGPRQSTSFTLTSVAWIESSSIIHFSLPRWQSHSTNGWNIWTTRREFEQVLSLHCRFSRCRFGVRQAVKFTVLLLARITTITSFGSCFLQRWFCLLYLSVNWSLNVIVDWKVKHFPAFYTELLEWNYILDAFYFENVTHFLSP